MVSRSGSHIGTANREELLLEGMLLRVALLLAR